MLLIDKIKCASAFDTYKNMNNIINKFLLAGDKFMPEMHLRQPRFAYSACGPFTRHKERIKKFKQTGDMRYKFFDSKVTSPDKKATAERSAKHVVGSGINKEKSRPLILADELHKPVIRKFKKRKVYSQFKDNICGVDLADMQSLSRKNKGIKYLLCAIDLYSKYAFVIPLENKKGISVTNGFNEIIKQSNRKPNKIWVDQGREFYNNVFKKWLSDNNIIMYSTYNKGKSVVAERFIRTLKSKLYKHMTAIGKNVYYDVLDDVVNKYNNTKHSTIKMKPIDVENNNKRVYIDEHNEKNSRFKVGDRIRISKLKNIFAKGYTPNWSSETVIVDKVNDTVPYMYNLKDLNDEKILVSFYDRELQKTIL